MTIQVPSPYAPVTVVTKDGKDAQVPTLTNPVTVLAENDLTPLQRQIDQLAARVEALEEGEEPPIVEPPPDGTEPPPDGGSPPDPVEPPPDLIPPARDDMRAIIRIGGHDYEYDADSVPNLGTFQDSIGPMLGLGRRFAMSCHRVTREDCPIRVDFRAVEGWWSAVFDYGDAFGKLGPVANLKGPITVAIGGEVVELWGHPWGVRWRWQSGPWPFAHIPVADLVAHGLLLDYDPEVPCGTAPRGFTATYTPLAYESVGLMPGMPSTGSRQDIGLTTDLQAQFINGAADVSGVLAQGEAAASVPWRLYDSEHGRTIDVVREYPGVGIETNGSPHLAHAALSTVSVRFSGAAGLAVPTYVTIAGIGYGTPGGTLPESGELTLNCWQNGWGAIDPGTGAVGELPSGMTGTVVPDSFVPNSGIFPDSAHQPAISWLPFLLTGDPYFLENLQSQVAFAFAETGTSGMSSYTPGLIQTRGAAWNTRSIAQAATVTPEDAPSWLLSRDAMVASLDFCINGMTQLIASPPVPCVETFHDPHANSFTYKAPWQTDFFILTAAFVTRLHERYRPILQWMVQHAIARLDGKSGWGRGSPDPYQLFIGEPHEDYAQSYYDSWAAAWTGNTGQASATGSELNMAEPPSGQMDYINGLRAALAAATQVLADDDPVLAEVHACLDYLTPYHQSWMRNGQSCELKWSIERH